MIYTIVLEITPLPPSSTSLRKSRRELPTEMLECGRKEVGVVRYVHRRVETLCRYVCSEAEESSHYSVDGPRKQRKTPGNK